MRDHVGLVVALFFGVVAGIPWASAAWKARLGEAGVGVKEVVAEKRLADRLAEREKHRDDREVKVALEGRDGVWYFGTKSGVMVVEGGKDSRLVVSGPAADVRGMLVQGAGRVWVAAKDGVWVGERDTWNRVLNEDAHSVTAAQGGRMVVVTKRSGVMESGDGGTSWIPVAAAGGMGQPEQTGKDRAKY